MRLNSLKLSSNRKKSIALHVSHDFILAFSPRSLVKLKSFSPWVPDVWPASSSIPFLELKLCHILDRIHFGVKSLNESTDWDPASVTGPSKCQKHAKIPPNIIYIVLFSTILCLRVKMHHFLGFNPGWSNEIHNFWVKIVIIKDIDSNF